MTERRVEFEVIHGRPDVCRSCKAGIVWTDSGYKGPLDPKTRRVDDAGRSFMESHYAHCPDAKRWRTRRRPRR